MEILRRKPIAREIIMARSAKASATKLAKRITKVCAVCEKTWLEKPSHAWRIYCSRECAASAARKPGVNKTCPFCSKVFTTKRANRRNIFCSIECCRAHRSEWQKSTGHTPQQFVKREKWLASVQSEENRKAISAANLGKVCHTPKTKRYSPNHTFAVECFFRDPQNVVRYCKNISRFVHENQSLFAPDDVIRKIYKGKPTKSYNCNATQGLACIHRGYRMTWKGWTVVSNREGRERFDLIARNWQEPETAKPPLAKETESMQNSN